METNFSIKTEIEDAFDYHKLNTVQKLKYPELFNTSSVGKLTATEVTLRVEDDAPVYMKHTQCHLLEQFDVSLDKLESEDIIEQGELQPWASPTVPVRKPHGSIRICADYSKTIKANSDLERYPLPTIEEIRTKLSGGQEFSTLDLSQAYHQLELEENSRVCTTINTHGGLYQYKRLPFGIRSAVSIFHT